MSRKSLHRLKTRRPSAYSDVPSSSSNSTISGTNDSFYTAQTLSPSLGFSESNVPMDLRCSKPRKAIVIAVMGPTGAGKSTFIKAATGADVQIGETLFSCTQEIQTFWSKHPTNDYDICFVDTPGFDDTYRDDTQILELIANWLLRTYQGGVKLSGVLYLHSIVENRIPHSAVRTLDIFQRICGSDAFSGIGLVTTHWDNVAQQSADEVAQCARREEELRETFWRPLVELGAKTLRFENTCSSAWNIINSLTLKPRSLLIQREMGDKRMTLSETSAGRTLFSWLFRAAKSLKEAIDRLVRLLSSPSSVSADNTEQLKKEREKANEELRVIETQLDPQSVRRKPFNLRPERHQSRSPRRAKRTGSTS